MSIRTVFCCIRNCFDGTGFSVKSTTPRDKHYIVLDSSNMGNDVVLLKNNTRICGSGGALCSAPLVQSKSYFEVKLQQSGGWGIGVASRKADLNKIPGGSDGESWVFCSDGTLRHNNENIQFGLETPAEGDVMGISYDHIELKFYINGKCLDKPIAGIRGSVYPVIYVDDGAVLDLIVEDFQNALPSGFEKIMIEQSLL